MECDCGQNFIDVFSEELFLKLVEKVEILDWDIKVCFLYENCIKLNIN